MWSWPRTSRTPARGLWSCDRDRDAESQPRPHPRRRTSRSGRCAAHVHSDARGGRQGRERDACAGGQRHPEHGRAADRRRRGSRTEPPARTGWRDRHLRAGRRPDPLQHHDRRGGRHGHQAQRTRSDALGRRAWSAVGRDRRCRDRGGLGRHQRIDAARLHRGAAHGAALAASSAAASNSRSTRAETPSSRRSTHGPGSSSPTGPSWRSSSAAPSTRSPT